jgi:hypothetical protein
MHDRKVVGTNSSFALKYRRQLDNKKVSEFSKDDRYMVEEKKYRFHSSNLQRLIDKRTIRALAKENNYGKPMSGKEMAIYNGLVDAHVKEYLESKRQTQSRPLSPELERARYYSTLLRMSYRAPDAQPVIFEDVNPLVWGGLTRRYEDVRQFYDNERYQQWLYKTAIINGHIDHVPAYLVPETGRMMSSRYQGELLSHLAPPERFNAMSPGEREFKWNEFLRLVNQFEDFTRAYDGIRMVGNFVYRPHAYTVSAKSDSIAEKDTTVINALPSPEVFEAANPTLRETTTYSFTGFKKPESKPTRSNSQDYSNGTMPTLAARKAWANLHTMSGVYAPQDTPDLQEELSALIDQRNAIECRIQELYTKIQANTPSETVVTPLNLKHQA